MTTDVVTPAAALALDVAVARPRVVVGYTDGPAGEAALVQGGFEADLRHGALTVVHGLTGAEMPQRYGLPDQELDRHRHAVDRIVAQAQAVLPYLAASDLRVIDRPMADELIAASGRAALLVVGVTTHHAVVAAALDTVPHQVVQRSQCPVLVVPAVARHRRIARVVCVVDRSDESLVALRWAADDAEARGVPLVVADMRTPRESEPTDDNDGLFLQVWLRRKAPKIEASVVGVLDRRPTDQLLEIAADEGLLVIGRSQTGCHVGFASLAQVLASQTRVPVVAVPA